MVESWRIKKYYDKRILVETQRVLDSDVPDSIVCLTGAELEMLRNIVAYLNRRSTFVSTYEQNHYLCPNNSDWDTLSALVADLEGKLMGCDLDALIDAITAQTAVIDVLRQCVCENTAYQGKVAGQLPDVAGYVDNQDVTYLAPGETEATFTPPATDEERCEMAQSIWYYTYQMYTEHLLPFADSSSDRITGLIVASVGFGAVAGFIGIPVAILAAIVVVIVAWGIGGAIENFVNWMLGTKDEIICLLYNNLPDVDAAAAAVRAYVDAASEISYLDRAVLKTVLCSPWHYTWILKDQELNGTWDEYFVPGQCVVCSEPPPGCWWFGPCVLSDWTGGLVECAGGGVWLKGGLAYWTKQYQVPASGSYLVVHFTPRSDGYPEARTNFGLTKVSNLEHTGVIVGVDYPVNIPVTVWGAVPAGLWGQEVYFHMQQSAYWCEPTYWCFLDEPPE